MNDELPDTIKHPEFFLRAKPAGFDGVFDWSWTQGCFGNSKIAPMDIDACIEHNGQFLIIETKDNGVPIPKGQLITLERLFSEGNKTIMIVYGKKEPESFEVWNARTRKKYNKDGITEARKLVKGWYDWAHNQKGTLK